MIPAAGRVMVTPTKARNLAQLTSLIITIATLKANTTHSYAYSLVHPLLPTGFTMTPVVFFTGFGFL